MPKRAKMTGWYDPPRLVTIGFRVAISTVFGEFADRREAIAAARAVDPTALDSSYDYSGEAADGDFWFDFVADTGDGWNSTYAIARLVADPALAVAGLDEPLPCGRLVVMGGDQVYPTASRDDYSDKLSRAVRRRVWQAARQTGAACRALSAGHGERPIPRALPAVPAPGHARRETRNCSKAVARRRGTDCRRFGDDAT
jgi:hypothetical protein